MNQFWTLKTWTQSPADPKPCWLCQCQCPALYNIPLLLFWFSNFPLFYIIINMTYKSIQVLIFVSTPLSLWLCFFPCFLPAYVARHMYWLPWNNYCLSSSWLEGGSCSECPWGPSNIPNPHYSSNFLSFWIPTLSLNYSHLLFSSASVPFSSGPSHCCIFSWLSPSFPTTLEQGLDSCFEPSQKIIIM